MDSIGRGGEKAPHLGGGGFRLKKPQAVICRAAATSLLQIHAQFPYINNKYFKTPGSQKPAVGEQGG